MFRVFDVHAHHGLFLSTIDTDDVESYHKIFKKFGIEKCIMSSSRAIYSDFSEGNEEISLFLETTNNVFGYITVNANYLDLSVKELEKHAKNKKFVGVKIHPLCAQEPINTKRSRELMDVV